MCRPKSVIVLMESADRSLDHESDPIKDWEFIHSYVMSHTLLDIFTWLSHRPCLGRFFKSHLFEQFSLSYDIIVNFVEGHERSRKMIQMVIENKEFVNRILEES